MLKLKANPTFRGKVTIPAPDGEVVADFEFKHRTRKAHGEWLKSLTENKTPMLDVVMDMAVEWFDADAPFSREAIDEFLQNYHAAGDAIFDRYIELLSGAKLGN